MKLKGSVDVLTPTENRYLPSYSTKASRRPQRGSHWRLAAVLLILTTLLVVCEADGMCGACLNGGLLLMPNNIFGYCRCRCAGEFKGPRCQFLKKRDIGLGGFGREEAVRHGKVLRSHSRPSHPALVLDELLQRLVENSRVVGQPVREDRGMNPSNAIEVRQPLSRNSSKYSDKSGKADHSIGRLEGKDTSARSDAVGKASSDLTQLGYFEEDPLDYSMDSHNYNAVWNTRNSENVFGKNEIEMRR